MDTKDNNDRFSNKHVVVVGINHTSSNTDLRDKLIFTGTKKETALNKLAQWEGIIESVLLSTCNRMEIYAVVENTREGKDLLLNFISDFHSLSRDQFESNMYYYSSRKAIEHLYYVVCSLDSMVIGEYQILGQVKDSYREAMRKGYTSTLLNKLFHMAIETGKRARTETDIGKGAVSVSSVAVELASKILGKLNSKSAIIIGAGEMSKITARHLVTSGIKKLYFANRTRERAMELSDYFNGIALGLDERHEVMAQCDIVLTSTGAPHYIIHKDEIKAVMAKRKNQAIFLIDIAAPRDIHPDVGNIDNVFLYSIDDLTKVVNDNTNMRASEIEKVRVILKEEQEKFFTWLESLKVLPTLILLRKKFEIMCNEELERYSSALSDMPESSQKLVRQFASSLTKKYLRIPSKVLKEKIVDLDPALLANSVTQLFELNSEENGQTPHDSK